MLLGFYGLDYLTFFFVRFTQYMILLWRMMHPHPHVDHVMLATPHPLSLPVAFLLVCCALLLVSISDESSSKVRVLFFLFCFVPFCLSKYNTAPTAPYYSMPILHLT